MVLLVVAVRIYYFINENPPRLYESKGGMSSFYGYMTHAVVYTIVAAESVIMFWVTFFLTAYLFIMYKL